MEVDGGGGVSGTDDEKEEGEDEVLVEGEGGGKYEEKKEEGFLVEFGGRVATVQVAAGHNAAFHISEEDFMMIDFIFHIFASLHLFGDDDDDDCYLSSK